jgi:DNA ligase D-like protein (predicted 3'-phosphoesterase)
MDLILYNKKHHLDKTKEPPRKPGREPSAFPIFVIQKHAASKLHYDFRLEINGVLKSWAIPNGPPDGSRTKYLMVETEDHPIEYSNFEGIIPKGEYGGGTVEIWDRGTFENSTIKDEKIINIDQALKQGHITINLKGGKLHGRFSLILFKQEKNAKKWLLIQKLHDTMVN